MAETKEWVVTDPSGKEFVVTAPAAATQDEVLGYAKTEFNRSAKSVSHQATGQEVGASLGESRPGQGDFLSIARSIATGGFSPVTAEDLATVGEMGKRAALPTGLGIGGAALGAAFPVLGPATPIVGESAGNVLGEGINQLTGITEPSIGQLIAAGVAGPMMRGAGAAFQGAKRLIAPRLPGAGAALRAHGIQRAEGLKGTLKPMTPSEKLYAEVEQYNPKVDLMPLKGKVDELLAVEAQATEGLTLPTTTRVAKGLKKEFFTPKEAAGKVSAIVDELGRPFAKGVQEDLGQALGQGDFQQVRILMRRVNDKIGALKAKGGEGLGDMMQIKRGLHESLEAAADSEVGVAAQKLRAANKAFGQELASDTIDEVITKNFGRALEGTEQLSSNAAKAINQIDDAFRKDPKLAGYLPKGELEKIKNTLDEIRKLPIRGAPAGADAGSKLMLRRSVVGGGIGELGAQALGLPPGVGAATGTLAGVGAAEIISKSLQSPKGRNLLLKMVHAPGGFDYPKLAALASFVRAQTAESGKVAEGIKSALKDREVTLEEKLQVIDMGARIGGAGSLLEY